MGHAAVQKQGSREAPSSSVLKGKAKTVVRMLLGQSKTALGKKRKPQELKGVEKTADVESRPGRRASDRIIPHSRELL